MNQIDQAIEYLQRLYGLPADVLVLFSCIVVGYALRFIKRFPNDGIPVAVILWGAVAMTLVADTRATNITLRVWLVRNIMVGLIIGFVAWMMHKSLLSKVENWIAEKWPDTLGNTDFFQRKASDNPPLTKSEAGATPPK